MLVVGDLSPVPLLSSLGMFNVLLPPLVVLVI